MAWVRVGRQVSEGVLVRTFEHGVCVEATM